jgi:hypothetical protein
MAIAFDVNDLEAGSAVRSKGVRQRVVRAVGGTRGTESFEGRQKPAQRRRFDRLNRVELDELNDLWGMYDSSIGQRSVHGAVEARLLRAPPRDEVRSDILDELLRAGGRMPEGALLRIVAAQKGKATVYEARRALKMLQVYGKVERVAVDVPPMPDAIKMERSSKTPPGDGTGIVSMTMTFAPDRLTDAQREWTGYEVRIVRRPEDEALSPAEDPARERGDLTMSTLARVRSTIHERRLALKMDQWRKQDEALEAELHQCYCSDNQAGHYATSDGHDGVSSRQRAGMERAGSALSLIMPTHRRILRRFYFERGPSFLACVQKGWQADWLHATDELLCVAEFTERAQVATKAVGAPTVVTLLRSREHDESWLDQLRRSCDEVVGESSLAYKEARRSIAPS